MDKETKEKMLDLFDELGVQFREIIIKILRDKNKVATGELIKSVDYALGEQSGKYFIELIAAEHWEYVNFGRLPGKFAPVAPLRAWVVAKGIPESAVWAINWKIKKEGIAAVPFLEQSIKEIEIKYKETLERDLGEIWAEEWGRKLRTAFRTEQTRYKRD
jgi:hypothetical protein